jgi:hypothetical protein
MADEGSCNHGEERRALLTANTTLQLADRILEGLAARILLRYEDGARMTLEACQNLK